MMSRFFLIVIIIFISVFNSRASLYDFASTVDSSKALKIDSALNSYEISTGIRLTITTITYDKHEKALSEIAGDNEILIFIIPEKKICISKIGKKLRRYVTDTYVSLILTRNIHPSFTSKAYAKGLGELISELTNKLGSHSLYEREAILIEAAIRAEMRRDMFANATMWILSVVGLSLCIYFPLHRRKLLSKIKSEKTRLSNETNMEEEQEKEKVAKDTYKELV